MSASRANPSGEAAASYWPLRAAAPATFIKTKEKVELKNPGDMILVGKQLFPLFEVLKGQKSRSEVRSHKGDVSALTSDL